MNEARHQEDVLLFYFVRVPLLDYLYFRTFHLEPMNIIMTNQLLGKGV